MDIAILAGGYGTRLKGLWDKPKCLVPYQGRPVIEYIVNKALELKPRKIFLLLGHKASQVVGWREDCCPHRDVVPIIETVPEGTASALRKALPLMISPVLVLNGDTIPAYDLIILTYAFSNISRSRIAWTKGVQAGASLFSSYSLAKIQTTDEKDLRNYIFDKNNQDIEVSGFIDIGTPEYFAQTISKKAAQ